MCVFYSEREPLFSELGFYRGRGHSLKHSIERREGDGNQGADVTSMNTFRRTAVTLCES